MKEVNCFDLFSGLGGLSFGLKQSGINIQWANEFDKHSAASYSASHDETQLFQEDVKDLYKRLVDRDSDLPKKGEVGLIAGGPPCQGFSGYNRHRSPSDPRNSLVETFLDFVDFLRPQFVLMENVPGMLSLDGGKVPKLLLKVLKEIGYKTKLGILQAGYYGIPQKRSRVFIWGSLDEKLVPDFPEPTHLFPRTTVFGATAFRDNLVKPIGGDRNLFWTPKETVTVGDAISDLPAIPNGGGKDLMPYKLPPGTDYQRAIRTGSKQLWNHCSAKLGEVMYARCRAVPKRPGAGWLDLPNNLKPKNLLRHGDDRYPNRFGRLHWSGTFNTILTRAYPYWSAVFHPEQDRVISVRECARAQGIPDSLRIHGPVSSAYKQVGNAVPPTLAQKLGEALLSKL